MSLNMTEILTNPLARSGKSGDFVRLVLAEAAQYGMPGNIVAMLDDVAAMLGFYAPMPLGQAAHVAGPIVNWRTSPEQPLFDRIREVEALAFKQRALLAFGAGKPGQMVGTAEILCAMGNIIEGDSPPEYYEIFQWAGVDVLKTLTGDSAEAILADPGKQNWKKIEDDEVVKPGGRLYPTYQNVCTSIRRYAIAALENSHKHPRNYLRPYAAQILEGYAKIRREAVADRLPDIVTALDVTAASIRSMYPDLKDLDTELEALKSLRQIKDDERVSVFD